MLKTVVSRVIPAVVGPLFVLALVLAFFAAPNQTVVAASAQREVMNTTPSTSTIFFEDFSEEVAVNRCKDVWTNWATVPAGTCRIENLNAGYFGGYCAAGNIDCVDMYGSPGGAPGSLVSRVISLTPGYSHTVSLFVGGNQRVNRLETLSIRGFSDGQSVLSTTLSRNVNDIYTSTFNFSIPPTATGSFTLSIKDITLTDQDGRGAILNRVIIDQGNSMGPEAIEINPINAVVPPSSALQFTATAYLGGQPIAWPMYWSVRDCGEVDQSGLFTSPWLSNQTCWVEVTALSTTLTVSAPVDIVPGPVVNMIIAANHNTTTAGTPLGMSIQQIDAQWNLVTADPNLAAVEFNPPQAYFVDGQFTSTVAGTYDVRATSLLSGAEGVSATTVISVEAGPAAFLAVSPSEASTPPNGNVHLIAYVADLFFNQRQDPVYWGTSCGRLTGLIEPNEVVYTAPSLVGTCTVTATLGALHATSVITTVPGPTQFVTVSVPSHVATAGTWITFTATAYDSNGNITHDAPSDFTWQVNGPTGYIFDQGALYATVATEYDVFARVDNKVGASYVDYQAALPAVVQISPAITQTMPMEVHHFSALIFDGFGNPVYVPEAPNWYVWCADGDCGSITQTGDYTGPQSCTVDKQIVLHAQYSVIPFGGELRFACGAITTKKVYLPLIIR